MCFLTETYKWIPALESENAEYLNTCKQISGFLSKETPERTTCLIKLNAEMIALINERQKIFKTTYSIDQIITAFNDPEQARNDKTLKAVITHVLSDVLSENEAKHQFSLYGSGKAVTYLSFIEPDLFRDQLRQGRQWKDPTVPGEHGEFTHRIQWYMITNACKPNTKELLIKTPNGGWIAFYKWLGTIRHGECNQLNQEDLDIIRKWVFDDTKNQSIAEKVIAKLQNKTINFGKTNKASLIELLTEAVANYGFSVEKENKDQYINTLASEIITLIEPHLQKSFQSTPGFLEGAWHSTNTQGQYKIKAEDWWKLGLWDALVDRNPIDRPYIFGPYNTNHKLDFCAPENLSPYLISSQFKNVTTNNLLHAFLSRRMEKRKEQINISALGDYYARKLHGTSLTYLPPTKQEILALIALGVWSIRTFPILEPDKIASKKILVEQYNTAVFVDAFSKYSEEIDLANERLKEIELSMQEEEFVSRNIRNLVS